jgi:phosphate transport system permease protein
LTLSFAALVLVVLLGIIASLFLRAIPAMQEFGFAFITTIEWDPVNDKYGGLIAIVGTLATSVIALLIAFPVSFGIALFLTEICPAWLKRPLGTSIELLAGCRALFTACGVCLFLLRYFPNISNRLWPLHWVNCQ